MAEVGREGGREGWRDGGNEAGWVGDSFFPMIMDEEARRGCISDKL